MKKAELLRRIVELDERVAKLTDSMKFLVEENAKITHQTRDYVERVRAMERRIVTQERFTYRQMNPEAFERLEKLKQAQLERRQTGDNVLAAVAGQPSVTVTATEALTTAEHDMAELKREFGSPVLSRVIPPEEWTKEEHEDHWRRQEEMEAARRVERLAAIAGQPSVTVTATEALTTAEHDMAGKLRELLGPMAPDYMRQIDVPVPHQPTHGEKVYYPEGCPPRTLFNPELINEYFRGKPTGEDVASWVIDALNFAVPSVAWCGTVGKIRDLNGEFKYRPWSSSHFVIGYDGKELGLFVSTPHGFKKSTERRIVTSGEG